MAALVPSRGGTAALPGGTFRMGSSRKRLLRDSSAAGQGLRSMLRATTPAHLTTIPAFLMDRCEVTNAEFQRFIRARPEWSRANIGGEYLRHWDGEVVPRGLEDLPVVFVTWKAALAYAEWHGMRLPTEAEWEFAARGGRSGAKYPWGNQEPTPRRANFAGSGIHHPVAVGSYPPNPYGLFDLAGNVWEFCLDEWAPYDPAPQLQTEAEVGRMLHAAAERRVIRGGGFDGDALNLRVTARDSHRAGNPAAYVGFRCARSV